MIDKFKIILTVMLIIFAMTKPYVPNFGIATKTLTMKKTELITKFLLILFDLDGDNVAWTNASVMPFIPSTITYIQ